MYNFIDTTQVQPASSNLGAESFKINGEYLENLVPGYQTLNVTGRELLGSEIDTLSIAGINGEEYIGNRYPAREITVKYKLEAKTCGGFRDAFNKLSAALNVEEAKLVFDDEPDKYFVGTRSDVGDVPEGKNAIVSTFIFYCSDPFKYSATEKEFIATINDNGIMETTIVNNGTESVPISYEITHNHENGYIGIVSEYGAMQFGQISERDEEVKQKSEVLLNYANGQEIYNALTKGGAFISPYLNNGAFRVNTVDNVKYLEIDSNNVGSGSYWHGAGGYKKIPADTNGHVGAKNFKASAKVWFQGTAARQQGAIDFCISNGSDIIASFQIWDGQTGTHQSYVDMFIGKTLKKRYTYNADASGWSSRNDGQIYIQKSGELFTFGFGTERYQFREPSMKDVEADQINVFLSLASGDTYWQMTWACVEKISFRTDSVDYNYDIPNRYPSGTIVAINGEEGRIYVDGVPHMEDEITGTQYFLAPPGETTVQFTYSDFSEPVPTIKARIRETYL